MKGAYSLTDSHEGLMPGFSIQSDPTTYLGLGSDLLDFQPQLSLHTMELWPLTGIEQVSSEKCQESLS